ncbi:MAG TPA: Smr/MutS family protein, partial [Chroococcidiopsis sp.]
VKSTHKDAVPGIVHDASASGATLYVEPHTIVESGNRLRQLLRQEQVEEEAVRRRLSEQVAAVKPDLERLLAIVTTLDLATARARYSLWLGANSPRFIRFGTAAGVGAGIGTEAGGDRPSASPEMPSELSPETQSADRSTAKSTAQSIDKSTDESIVLRQLRHPLLIWQQQHENGPTVVPIDLVIQPSIRVVAITGPNTGGKTVTLKTLGLAVLMAKAGLFVPAREPVELPWFEQVLADIGDEQSLQQSLSTFSGHVRRISRILNALNALNPQPQAAALPSAPAQDTTQAIEPEGELLERDSPEGELPEDKQDPSPALPPSLPPALPTSPSPSPPLCSSLVLLDEVGAGTDPSEGSALAIALLHYLADHAALTIATTHFGELKALKYQDPRFENASVEFDDVSLSPTYRLLWGIPGRSNALAIARRLGLNEAVIAEAQTYAGMNAAADVNQVIAGLEAQRRQQEEKAQTAAQLVQQAERLHQEVARKADLLKQRERELQVQQEQAIQTAIAMAKTEIAQVIRKLQKGNTTAQDAQQATDALQQIAEQRLPSRQQPAKPKPGFRPQVGDRVRIPRLGQVAEVLTNPDDDGELSVRFGLMKMTVSLTDVESLQGEKAATPEPKPVREKPAEKAAPPPPPQAPAVRTSRNTLDIRGNRVGDAEVLLEKAIAHAPAGPLWIIHGHGTGKLKKGVHEFLQRHPQISRFEDAEQSDGGTGVTVAYVD